MTEPEGPLKIQEPCVVVVIETATVVAGAVAVAGTGRAELAAAAAGAALPAGVGIVVSGDGCAKLARKRLNASASCSDESTVVLGARVIATDGIAGSVF
jgi:hypothetical protein